MINRRSSGVASLHTLVLAAEAVLLWSGLAWLVTAIRTIEFTTLLPLAAYPIAIAFSLVFSMGTALRMDVSIMSPGWTDAMRLAFRQVLAITCAILAVAVGFKDPGISRLFLAVYISATAIIFVILNRFQPEWVAWLIYGNSKRVPTLILGNPDLFPQFQAWLDLQEKVGLAPIGTVSYRGMTPRMPGLPMLGEFSDLKTVINTTGARQVLMLNLPVNAEDSEHLARVCAACGCRLLVHNNVTFQLSYPLRLVMQDGYTFLAFQDEPLEDPLNRFVKRTLDIALSIPVVLLLLPPLTALVWLMQRVQSRGPVFYRQERSGRAGRTFQIIKFRTMHEAIGAAAEKIGGNEARVFAFGRFLRRSSLDELPQFWNTLVGDMSVVGPRPHHVSHDHLFAGTVNEYRVRFFVKPGITGLAQSRGFRGDVQTSESLQERLRLDLIYIHTWSIWMDLAIIARTFTQVIAPPATAR